MKTKFNLVPRNLDEAKEFAALIAGSSLAPKEYKGKAQDVFVAVQYGAELGLSPMQALNTVCVINGRPAVYGDGMLALVKAHPHCRGVVEEPATEKNHWTATCTTLREGQPDVTRTFCKADAEAARLWGKDGPWKQYPGRMLQMRARSYALRDQWADALRGLAMAEEIRDIHAEVVLEPEEHQAPKSLRNKLRETLDKMDAKEIEAEVVEEVSDAVDV